MPDKKQTIGDLECVIVQNPNITPKAAVILCHGFGAPSTDLVGLGSQFSGADPVLADAVYIFPGAPLELDPAYDARAWWMIDIEKIQTLAATGQTREMKGESPERLPVCRASINKVIEFACKEYSLAAAQVIIGGFSQGSMLSTDVALNYPQQLGGLIVWSGALINEAEWKQAAAKQAKLNIVQSHGNVDPILPVSGARDLCAMLKEAGHDVEYVEFNGQHQIPMEALQAAAQLIGKLTSAEELTE